MKERINNLLKTMSAGTFEREEIIALSLLGAFSGESVFLLGLPGVGKSMIARRLKMAFKDSRGFEYLMSRFSTPDEIFGPVSISKLKDEDTYERIVDGYLPTADVVFLDEIWKAGPAIQNSLLTVLNEKIYRNGKTDIELPLKAVISASNELPAEGEGLEAIWDRFLIRYVVKPIEGRNEFLSLITEKPELCVIPENIKINDEDFKAIQEAAVEVKVPFEVSELIYTIRRTLSETRENMNEAVDVTKTDLIEPPYVSDRRWKKIVGVMRTSAYLNDRTSIDLSDCLLMIHMLWDNEDQANSIRRLVGQAIAESCRRNRIDFMGSIEGKNFTKPVGELVSPDGQHYVITVGDEDILVSKSDYNNLSKTEPHFGVVTDDGHLLINDNPTGLTVTKTDDGICINSFAYPLMRDSKLRSGTVKAMMSHVMKDADVIEKAFSDLVENNIFLLTYNGYPFMQAAFSHTKNEIKRRGY